jgi:glutamate-ammonia-ligase adenylyltransferase
VRRIKARVDKERLPRGADPSSHLKLGRGGLADSWRWVSRVRNAITLVRGRGSDQLPHDIRERAAVANVLGYPAGATDEMVNDHLRTMRVSHGVVDRVFWG